MKIKETVIAHAESAGAMLINQSPDNSLQFLKRKLLYWEIARGAISIFNSNTPPTHENKRE
jgi:hypothetical protein